MFSSILEIFSPFVKFSLGLPPVSAGFYCLYHTSFHSCHIYSLASCKQKILSIFDRILICKRYIYLFFSSFYLFFNNFCWFCNDFYSFWSSCHCSKCCVDSFKVCCFCSVHDKEPVNNNPNPCKEK